MPSSSSSETNQNKIQNPNVQQQVPFVQSYVQPTITNSQIVQPGGVQYYNPYVSYQQPVYYSQAPIQYAQQQNVQGVVNAGVSQQKVASQQVVTGGQPVQSSFVLQSQQQPQPVLGQSTVSYGNPIKGETHVEYVPYQKTYVDYEEQVYYEQVPKQKRVRDYYAVEYITEYQPVTRYETVTEHIAQTRTEQIPQQKIEYVPQTRVEYVPQYTTEYVEQQRVEYIPVTKQIEKIEYQPIQKSFVRAAPEKPAEIIVENQQVAGSQAQVQVQQSQAPFYYSQAPVQYSQQPVVYASGYQQYPYYVQGPGGVVVQQGQAQAQQGDRKSSSSSD